MSEMLGTFFKYLFALLGVAAVLAVLSQVVSTNKDGTFVSQLTQAIGNIQQLYAGQSSYASVTTANLVSAQAFPSGMLNDGAPVNPWGGTVTVAPDAVVTSFDVTTTVVPQADCAHIVTSLTNYSSVSINATVFPAGSDAGAMGAACTAAGNTILFVVQG
jgi:type II secretory pathway pseudopilin PulG